MTEKFLKPFIPNTGILSATPSDPQGYVTKDGMWAAVPFGKKFMIIHNGQQESVVNTLKSAKTYISKQIKANKSKTASLEKFL